MVADRHWWPLAERARDQATIGRVTSSSLKLEFSMVKIKVLRWGDFASLLSVTDDGKLEMMGFSLRRGRALSSSQLSLVRSWN